MSSLPFVERTGAIEVVTAVAEGDKRFTDINETVPITSATVSNRLKEGKVENLWKEELDHNTDGSARRVYVLKPLGREVAEAVVESNLLELIEQKEKIEMEIDRKIEQELVGILDEDR